MLITAGPTREPLDPVRYISNHSSGKMGFALAAAAAEQGAKVLLVKGPTAIAPPDDVEVIDVESAEEMYQAATKAFPHADIAIMAAAVADYSPATVAQQKIKKSENTVSLQLKKTKDILRTLGERKTAHQLLIGFALETHDELANARKKLEKKKANMIVLNSPAGDSGFGHDTNRVTLVGPGEKIVKFDVKPKTAVAHDIISAIEELL